MAARVGDNFHAIHQTERWAIFAPGYGPRPNPDAPATSTAAHFRELIKVAAPAGTWDTPNTSWAVERGSGTAREPGDVGGQLQRIVAEDALGQSTCGSI